MASSSRRSTVGVGSSRTAITTAPRSIKVSIDFGTTGTGFCWSSDNAAQINACSEYPRSTGSAAGNLRAPKTRTALLYKDGEAIAWGAVALAQYAALSTAERVQHQLFKEAVKLALDPRSTRSMPPGWDAERVAADFLRLFREFVVDKLHEQLAHLTMETVQWVLTVPAAWDDATKGRLRTAAVTAGFTSAMVSDALVMVHEPEAAAMHCHKDRTTGYVPAGGDIVVVVDAGGGTVDFTIHQVVQRGAEQVLSEAAHCTGLYAGSTFVDQNFVAYYRSQVGEAAFDAWATAAPAELAEIVMTRWESEKCSFPSGDAVHIPIPALLKQRMTPEDRAALLDHNQGEDEDPTSDYDDRVRLTPAVIKGFFDPVVNRITDALEEQLERMDPATKVLLVGGFCGSQYLRDKIQEVVQRVQPTCSVLHPGDPLSAVMQGAVRYACNPDLIYARRSRLAYGIKISQPYHEGAPDKVWDDEKLDYYTHSVFRKFVNRNQLVPVNETVPYLVVPLHRDAEEVLVELYATDDNSKKYVWDGVRSMGCLHVLLPPCPPGEEVADEDGRLIRIEMFFGRAELKMTATDLQTRTVCDTRVRFTPERVPRMG